VRRGAYGVSILENCDRQPGKNLGYLKVLLYRVVGLLRLTMTLTVEVSRLRTTVHVGTPSLDVNVVDRILEHATQPRRFLVGSRL
jgi:hypothetical protein